MELSGWIKLHRKFLESTLKNKPSAGWLAIHFMLRAYWKPGKIIWNGTERDLLPGQFYTGTHQLSRQSGLSRQQIRCALRFLSTIEFLTIESTNRGSVITVLNYGYYQSEEEKQPASQPAINQQPTSIQPQIKKLRSLRSKEVKKTTNPVDLERFNIFWSIYPKKSGKEDAIKAFIKLSPSNELLKIILDAIDVQKQTEQWTKDGGKYIKSPAAWINGKRWEDEIEKGGKPNNANSIGQYQILKPQQ